VATGQWLGEPEAAPLHSWDGSLMAYANGDLTRPVFGVAHSDAHNTANTDLNSMDPSYDNSDVGEGKNGQIFQTLAPNAPSFELPLEDVDVVPGYYCVGIVAMDMATDELLYAWANPIFIGQ
jgi:hypothetical protein